MGPMQRMLGQLRHAAEVAPEGEAGDAELLDRFLQARDEVAFARLVRRHAGMVLGVCRRVTGDAHDADDAFQAVFCLLLLKAGTIRRRAALGSWLYGVAYRTALAARTRRARSRRREQSVDVMPQPPAPPADGPCDWQPLLDAALDRLPELYREPIVLCDLEGKSRRDAARLLRVAEGTLSSRLARGRRLLARRLARQGLALSGGTLAALLGHEATAAAPAALVDGVVHSGSRFITTQTAAGAFAAPVVALAQGVSKAMFVSKLKVLAVIVMLATLTLGPHWSGSGGVVAQNPAAVPTAQPVPRSGDADPPRPPHESGQFVIEVVALAMGGGDSGKPMVAPKLTADLGQRTFTRLAATLEGSVKERLLLRQLNFEAEVVRQRGPDVLLSFRMETKDRGADALVRGRSLEMENFVALGEWKEINDAASGLHCKVRVSSTNLAAQPTPLLPDPAPNTPAAAPRRGVGAPPPVLAQPAPTQPTAAAPTPPPPTTSNLMLPETLGNRVARVFEIKWAPAGHIGDRLRAKWSKPGLLATTVDDGTQRNLVVLAPRTDMAEIATMITAFDQRPEPEQPSPLVDPKASAALAPDGSRLAVASGEEVLLVDVKTGKLLSRSVGQGPVRALAFSPDGKLIASGSQTGAGGTAILYDAATGKIIRQAKVSRPIAVVNFAPGGTTLIIMTADSVQHLWDIVSGVLRDAMREQPK